MTTQTQAETDEAEPINKTAQAVFYVPEEYGSLREFAQDVDDRRDYFATTTREHVENTYKLVYPGTEIEIDEDKYHALQDQVLGSAELVHEQTVDTTSKHDERPYSFLKDALSNIWPKDHPDDDVTISNGFRLFRVDGDRAFKSYFNTTETPMLKEYDEQEPDDLFVEDSSERQAFVIRFKFDDMPPEYEEWVEENLVTDPVAQMARDYPFDTVRMVRCFERTETTTECPRV